MSEKRFYYPQLDGLRFIAALLVLIHHGPALPYLATVKTYGWVGVDLFLALSAFLITKLAVLEFETSGGFSLRAFFIRRALRIWPLYLAFATSVCALSAIFGKVDPSVALGWWLSHLSFSNNVATAAFGYSPVYWSSHLWTISLEEQAYLGIALFLSAYFLSGRKHALPILLGTVGILIIARLGLTVLGAKHPFVWVLPLRADAFLLGCLAGLIRIRPQGWLFFLGVAIVCTVALFPPVGSNNAYDVFGYTIIAVGSVMLILGATKIPLLGSPFISYLGKISYGIYVYHLAGLYVGDVLSDGKPVPLMVIAVGTTVGMAAISYRFLERPFLKLKTRFQIVQSRAV